jgi:hypothetical protein
LRRQRWRLGRRRLRFDRRFGGWFGFHTLRLYFGLLFGNVRRINERLLCHLNGCLTIARYAGSLTYFLGRGWLFPLWDLEVSEKIGEIVTGGGWFFLTNEQPMGRCGRERLDGGWRCGRFRLGGGGRHRLPRNRRRFLGQRRLYGGSKVRGLLVGNHGLGRRAR